MNNYQAFTALLWFGYKEDCLGDYQEGDLSAIDALLEIFKDSNDEIPNRNPITYKEFYEHYVKYSHPRGRE